ncbi:hypothetical protein HX13_10500 [Chryseobacterium sp. P1-3]|uniref:Uncharacterized protein n=1 Tax=Chryseobacterium gallinarum TaxID=1324352 RepID=A0A0G3M5U6_CHRGL|nr:MULTISPECIES: hypothetical protein [Chryseobacterium]AKK74239.1 hypothetical protein OK18_17985 [Chryseobacterium gallinarum]KFF74544.1 hypothetical protein HX13_10500 [Chryseobacterium sp. P1-3]MCL8538091.1 hypothetical protein [Chryseobacterium gallinarum]
MKNIIIIIGLFFAASVPAQMAVEKNQADGDGLLDFAANTTKGILLPIVETLPANAVGGTLLMDRNDQILKMNVESSWMPLSDTGSVAGVTFNTSGEIPGDNRIIMGAPTSVAPGVLVLESPNKALVLPKIANPHINVKSPYPGMICYDTVSKSMAVFDGLKWSYWK